MEIIGTIKEIKNTQEVGNGFKKRELIIETHEKFPQTILIEFVQNNTAMLDKFETSASVKVGINLRGREWTNPETNQSKIFNSIQGWRIEHFDSKKETVSVKDHLGSRTDDDLPF